MTIPTGPKVGERYIPSETDGFGVRHRTGTAMHDGSKWVFEPLNPDDGMTLRQSTPAPLATQLRGFWGVSDQEKHMYVVCCEPRVVVAGWATKEEIKKEHPELTDVRMCVYWDLETGGPHGLAGKGPSDGCRITVAAPWQSINTKKETALLCSEDAVTRWEAEPWA